MATINTCILLTNIKIVILWVYMLYIQVDTLKQSQDPHLSQQH